VGSISHPFFSVLSPEVMFSSKHFIEDVNHVPVTWIFENYLGLPEPLTGQRVRINSLFNPNDKTPSMYLYYNKEAESYRYKCFSTGKGGNAVDLMMHLWNTGFAEASKKIITDYVAYQRSGKICETKIIEHARWQVADYKVRQWTKDDAAFWGSYNISSKLLEKYNVVPIARYIMQKKSGDNNVEQEFEVVSKFIYGYFNQEGQLYKIYQPKNRERKFIKLCNHTQGYDQLEDKPYLVIASSLKDCLAIKSMNLNCDVIAPDSENTMFSDDLMTEFKQVYLAIVTVFDSDQAGIQAMKNYKERHGLPFIYIPLEKDIAEVVRIHGVQKAMAEFVPAWTLQ
jgi:hypothetical protein